MNSLNIKRILATLSFLLLGATFCLAQSASYLRKKADSIFTKKSLVYFGKDSTLHKMAVDRSIHVFKNKGQLLESYDYDDIPNPDFGLIKEPRKAISVFDKEGRLMEIRDYYRKDALFTKETYSYFGLSGESVGYYYPLNQQTGKAKYIFDKHRNLIRMESYTLGETLGAPSVYDYVYDKHNHLIKERDTTAGDSSALVYQYKYDKHGDVIEKREDYIISPSKPIVTKMETYTYPSYDKKHNWTLQNTYIKGKLVYMVERRIVYRK